jgi:uncharacterized protein YbcI
MDKSNSNLAKQVALAAIAFEQERTGHAPKSVTTVMSDETLVVTLHGALSPAEQALAKSPEGAARVQEFHQQLFNDSGDLLRHEIKRITGVAVREAVMQVDCATGTVVKAFTSGTVVQVYLLAGSVATESWSETRRDSHEHGDGDGDGDGRKHDHAQPRKSVVS